MKPLLVLFLFVIPGLLKSQQDTTTSPVSLTGYVELYYAYDFNKPDDHLRPWFIYNHNRHNEFNLNLGLIRAAYSSSRVRANFSLAAGTYMNANYATEPGVLKNIFEANAGYKVSRTHSLWVDAGILPSHLGFESAVSKDCRALTRSLAAESSPYYESGIKLTYVTPKGSWLLSAMMLNGWQHIQRPAGNNTPAFGTQISYTPSPSLTLNYSTFFGSDQPDTVRKYRFFQDLYALVGISESIHLTAGFDLGLEQTAKGSSTYYYWYTPILMIQTSLDDHWSVTARGEYYADPDEVLLVTPGADGFRTLGISVNLDYQIRENAIWRIEGRWLKGKEDIFIKDGIPTNSNTAITSSLAVSF